MENQISAVAAPLPAQGIPDNVGLHTGSLMDQLLKCSLCGADPEIAAGEECGSSIDYWSKEISSHIPRPGSTALAICVPDQVQGIRFKIE